MRIDHVRRLCSTFSRHWLAGSLQSHRSWYPNLTALPDDCKVNHATWQLLAQIREAVNKVIEAQRNEGKLGGSLEAEVTLYLDQAISAQLAPMLLELRFALITSKVTIKAIEQKPADAVATELEGVSLTVAKSAHEKCERCWHRVEDIGVDPQHPTICGRCVTNVAGDGETREFV